ncbi:MAG: hypothetical protein ACYCXT_08625 [Acidiferrobacteraceae bacterium]
MESIAIALVKQEVYQDLYVCSENDKDPANILFSSMGRVGPIGLFTTLNADFYIVKEEGTRECQIYRKVLPHMAEHLRMLKTTTLNTLPGQSFKIPGSDKSNGTYAVSCRDVDWGKYDIVISMNVSLPTQLVRCYPNTLFCYMIGEANLATKRVKFGYDVCLNQEARGKVATRTGVIDFPYTFVGTDCLEKIIHKHLGDASSRRGIYVEINSSDERPVVNAPPSFSGLSSLGHPINLHKQLISANLVEIYHSKYFVKLGGRKLRGNSVIESISLGTPVLMDPNDVIHRELLPKEAWVVTPEDAYRTIEYLDKNNDAYDQLLMKERDLLKKYVYQAPLDSLLNCLQYKRNHKKRSFMDMFRSTR